jgi:hypothetical protein
MRTIIGIVFFLAFFCSNASAQNDTIIANKQDISVHDYIYRLGSEVYNNPDMTSHGYMTFFAAAQISSSSILHHQLFTELLFGTNFMEGDFHLGFYSEVHFGFNFFVTSLRFKPYLGAGFASFRDHIFRNGSYLIAGFALDNIIYINQEMNMVAGLNFTRTLFPDKFGGSQVINISDSYRIGLNIGIQTKSTIIDVE